MTRVVATATDTVGEQHFKENPYFSNAVLKKEYKFIPAPAAADEKADEDGVTQSMLDFSWDRDIEPQVSDGWVWTRRHRG